MKTLQGTGIPQTMGRLGEAGRSAGTLLAPSLSPARALNGFPIPVDLPLLWIRQHARSIPGPRLFHAYLASPPTPLVYSRVPIGELMPVRAVSLQCIRPGESVSTKYILSGCHGLQVAGVHARPVRAVVSALAVLGNMASMVHFHLRAYVLYQSGVGGNVGPNGPSVEVVPAVPLVAEGGPAPAPIGVNADLAPEALRQSVIAESGRGGTFGHVRLLRSRTAPRECVRTRRGSSCHFSEFPRYSLAGFPVSYAHHAVEFRPAFHEIKEARRGRFTCQDLRT